MKFKIITLGCKVNAYESEYMLEELLRNSYIYDAENPDIIIINTCSVTNTADTKSLKIVRREKRKYPNSILVVVGCSVQNNLEKYKDLNIDILLGNKNKSQIIPLITKYLKDKEKYVYYTQERDLPFENMRIAKFTTHTRAFLKIQDGCNNFCSYCIIPYLRGSIRSKDFLEAIDEVKTLVKNGHKEIVLTGIHTGSYNNSGHDLSDLIEALSLIDGLERIRISSIEITELNAKFLKLLKTNSKIANHLHIPLQSGSDTVLKKMNRKYDKAYFENKIKEIRSIRPDISITTDCIVGHPYESEECFLEYVEFCKKINFSKLHVFPYSPRTGTASSLMPPVKSEVKKERTNILLSLSKSLEENYYQKFIGKTLDILTEEYSDNYTIGTTSNYIKVYLEGEYKLNKLYSCVIDKVVNGISYAHIVGCLN